MLAYVAKLIIDGYTSGYEPNWSLRCEDCEKLSDGDLRVLAEMVLDGYTSGYLQVCTDPENDEVEESIYWSIEYNNDEMENDDGLTIDDLD